METEQQLIEPILPPQPASIPAPKPKKKAITVRKKNGVDIVVDKSKMTLFLEEYVKCNGNGTEAAMRVFNTPSRANAAAIAHIYLQRAQGMNRILLEEKGYAMGKMLDIALRKMEQSKTPEWWDRLMKFGGFADFMTKEGVTKTTVAVMEVQKELIDEYVEGEYVEDNIE